MWDEKNVGMRSGILLKLPWMSSFICLPTCERTDAPGSSSLRQHRSHAQVLYKGLPVQTKTLKPKLQSIEPDHYDRRGLHFSF